MQILIDFRENLSGIGKILAEDDRYDVVRKHLETGDFIINGRIIVERKTGVDFVHSLIDGRLFRQAGRMSRTGRTCVFLIEGDIPSFPWNQCPPNAVQGALVSLSLIWGIPVLFSKDNQDSASFIRIMANQSVPAWRPVTFRPGRRPKPFHKKQLFLLQGLPGVGITLAVRLLDHFGSIEKIFQAASRELAGVQGLGRKKAEKIRALIDQNVH